MSTAKIRGEIMLVLSESPLGSGGPALVAGALIRACTLFADCVVFVVNSQFSLDDRHVCASRFPGVRFEVLNLAKSVYPVKVRRLWCAVTLWPVSPVGFCPGDVSYQLACEVGASSYRAVIFDSFNFAKHLHVVPGVPMMLVPHDAYSLYAFRTLLHGATFVDRLKALWKLVAYSRYEEKQYPRFDAVLPVSDTDAGWLRALVPDAHSEGVHPAITLPVYTPRKPELTSRLTTPVRIAIAGNARIPSIRSELLTAGRELRSELGALPVLSDFFFWGHTSGGVTRSFRREARRLGIPLYDWVPDYATFLGGIDLYIYPQQACAGIQTKVIQAMAAGAVVVARRVVLAPLHAVDGVHAIVLDNYSNLRAVLSPLAEDGALRGGIGARASEHIRSLYNDRSFAGELETIINGLDNDGVRTVGWLTRKSTASPEMGWGE